jgi:hypothetical protein
MGNRGHTEDARGREQKKEREQLRLPAPTPSYRRRAWVEFQRALDPLARIKPLPPPRP